MHLPAKDLNSKLAVDQFHSRIQCVYTCVLALTVAPTLALFLFSPLLMANNQMLSERMTPGNWGIDIMTCWKQTSVSAYITVVIINWK